MASGRRSESLKHLLTVALGKEETDMPYQLIVGKFKCRSPADLAKINQKSLKPSSCSLAKMEMKR
jgi:hypothetical protein